MVIRWLISRRVSKSRDSAQGVDVGRRLVQQEKLRLAADARAMSVRWRWPPERAAKRRRARLSKPTSATASWAARRSACPGQPNHPRSPGAQPPHEHDVHHGGGEVGIVLYALRHVAHAEPCGPRRPAKHPHFPSARLQKAENQLQHGRLAAAVGADDANRLPPGDRQAHVLQSRVLRCTAVGGLTQVAEFEVRLSRREKVEVSGNSLLSPLLGFRHALPRGRESDWRIFAAISSRFFSTSGASESIGAAAPSIASAIAPAARTSNCG